MRFLHGSASGGNYQLIRAHTRRVEELSEVLRDIDKRGGWRISTRRFGAKRVFRYLENKMLGWFRRRKAWQKIAISLGGGATAIVVSSADVPQLVARAENAGVPTFSHVYGNARDFAIPPDPDAVAAGDSFLGTGGNLLDPNNKRCQRSTNDVVHYLVGDRGADLYCAGADTKDISKQIATMPRNARLVLISAGGDDSYPNEDGKPAFINVTKVLAGCIQIPLAQQNDHCVPYDAWQRGLVELGKVLPPLYRAARHRARNARIVVLGLPDIFENPYGPQVHGGSCDLIKDKDVNGMSSAIEPTAAHKGLTLNGVIEAAAAKVDGVEYVNLDKLMQSQLAGRHLCDKSGKTPLFHPLNWYQLWVHIYQVGGIPGMPKFLRDGTFDFFHPDAEFYRMEAADLRTYFKEHPEHDPRNPAHIMPLLLPAPLEPVRTPSPAPAFGA